MKNLIICLALATGFLVVSCSEKPVEKEVIVVPGAPAPATVIAVPSTIVVEKEKPSGTTITIDEKGAKLEANEVNIKLKK
jgi:hypothetical protein